MQFFSTSSSHRSSSKKDSFSFLLPIIQILSSLAGTFWINLTKLFTNGFQDFISLRYLNNVDQHKKYIIKKPSEVNV